jgi:uncharacterized membrane protein
MASTRVLIPAVLLGLSLSGCGDKIDAVRGVCALDLGSVTYEEQVKVILDKHCTACHGAALSGADRNGAPPSVNLDTYAGLKASATASNKRIQNGSMPPSSGLPQGERALVQCWLDLGLLER